MFRRGHNPRAKASRPPYHTTVTHLNMATSNKVGPPASSSSARSIAFVSTDPPQRLPTIPSPIPQPQVSSLPLNLIITSPSPVATATARSKRYRFTDAADIVLLKAVSGCNAHKAPWGRKGTLFEEAYATFLRIASPVVLDNKGPPTQKGLEDRFRMITTRRRAEVKRTAVASGIVEVYGEREVLLDDLILEMDEHFEQDRAEKGKRLEK